MMARAQAERPRMRLLNWKPMEKGRLRGFATVELPIGLKLVDCPVFVGDNGPWAALPSKPELDRDGKRRNGADGKPLYSAIAEWKSRELTDRFSAALIALVQHHLG